MQSKHKGVPKVETPREILISFKGFGYHLPHFLAKFLRLKHFDAVAVAQQFAQKVGGGTDVIGEVGVVCRGRELALRVMQGQRAQVIGHPLVGTQNDMGHGDVSGQHAKVSEK